MPQVKSSTRFEVFVRDDFTCQYCGAKPPEVRLEADHKIPLIQGGSNNLNNLITACRPCNHGKGGRTVEQIKMGQPIPVTETISYYPKSCSPLLFWRRNLEDEGSVSYRNFLESVKFGLITKSFCTLESDSFHAANKTLIMENAEMLSVEKFME